MFWKSSDYGQPQLIKCLALYQKLIDLFIDNETSAICNIIEGLMRQYLQCIWGP